MSRNASDLDGLFDKRPKLKKVDMIFSTWKVRSLYRAGSPVAVTKGISECKIDLMGGQKALRWHQTSSEYIFLYVKG
jgi:hypothetical protein